MSAVGVGQCWRVGRRNPHNVYAQWGDEPRGMDETDGDASLGYFRLTGDAEQAVVAVNAVAKIREVTETHADAPVGELIAEVRRLVDNDDHCTAEHYNPERDRKRAELHLGYPPADLPATLASVNDVRQVCEAAGLTQHRAGWWTDEAIQVVSTSGSGGLFVDRLGSAELPMGIRGRHLCEIWSGGPSSLLWHAIRAARVAS